MHKLVSRLACCSESTERDPRNEATWLPQMSSRMINLCCDSLVNLLHYCHQIWTGEYKTYPIYLENLHNNILLRQPIEIIVHITRFLPVHAKILLSLSSKHLRTILTTHFDLSFSSSLTAERQQAMFWLLLERDLPDQLRCHACFKRFKWIRRRFMFYECPQRFGLGPNGFHNHHIYWCGGFNYDKYKDFMCYGHGAMLSREVVDLILKAFHHGSQYGIPASYADHECNSMTGTHVHVVQAHRRFEGRIVQGQFYYARSYNLVIDLTKCLKDPKTALRFVICGHTTRVCWDLIIHAAQQENLQKPTDLGIRQCGQCATDFRVKLSPWSADHLTMVKIYIWQNHGDRWFYWPGDKGLST